MVSSNGYPSPTAFSTLFLFITSRCEGQHRQRPGAGAGQGETTGLGSFEERPRSREGGEERPTPSPPIRLHCFSCPNRRLRDLGYSKAG